MELTEFQNCLIQKCIKDAIKENKYKQFSNNAINELNKLIEKLEYENLTIEEKQKRFYDFHQNRIKKDIERERNINWLEV